MRGMWIGLMLLASVSWTSCAKPRPSADADGRPCIPAVVDAEMAMLLRAAQHYDVLAGDLIMTPECAKADSLERRNHVYELTRDR